MIINIKKYKVILLLSTFILTFFGLFMIKESSDIWAKYLYDDEMYFFKRQAIFIILGIVSFFVASRIRIEYLKKVSTLFLIITIVLLLLVLIPGLGITKNGSTSWLGTKEFSIQPSELLKISLILYFAYYLEKHFDASDKLRTLLFPIFILLISFGLIMLQPDFGTAFIIILGIISMLFCSRVRYKWFIFLIVCGLFGVTILIIKEGYRMKRITAFIDPFSDSLGSGFQIIQSLFALGPGGIVGKGFNGSVQKHYYLPEPQTDFIFAIIGEEFGLIGSFIVIILYVLIFYSAYKIILNSNSIFKSMLYLGIISIFAFQVLINLGVVVGLLPVTGITLPLISYGGSSLIIELFSLGIIYGDKQ